MTAVPVRARPAEAAGPEPKLSAAEDRSFAKQRGPLKDLAVGRSRAAVLLPADVGGGFGHGCAVVRVWLGARLRSRPDSWGCGHRCGSRLHRPRPLWVRVGPHRSGGTAPTRCCSCPSRVRVATPDCRLPSFPQVSGRIRVVCDTGNGWRYPRVPTTSRVPKAGRYAPRCEAGSGPPRPFGIRDVNLTAIG